MATINRCIFRPQTFKPPCSSNRKAGYAYSLPAIPLLTLALKDETVVMVTVLDATIHDTPLDRTLTLLELTSSRSLVRTPSLLCSN